MSVLRLAEMIIGACASTISPLLLRICVFCHCAIRLFGFVVAAKLESFLVYGMFLQGCRLNCHRKLNSCEAAARTYALIHLFTLDIKVFPLPFVDLGSYPFPHIANSHSFVQSFAGYHGASLCRHLIRIGRYPYTTQVQAIGIVTGIDGSIA